MAHKPKIRKLTPDPLITDLEVGIISHIIGYLCKKPICVDGCNLEIKTSGSFIYTVANSLIIVLTFLRYESKYLSKESMIALKLLHLQYLACYTSKSIRKSIIQNNYYTSIRKLIQVGINDEANRQYILKKHIQRCYLIEDSIGVSATELKKTQINLINLQERAKNTSNNSIFYIIKRLYIILAFTCNESSRRGPFRKDIILYFEKEMKSLYDTIPKDIRKHFEYCMMIANVNAIMLFPYSLPDLNLVNKFIDANPIFPFLEGAKSVSYKIKDTDLQNPEVAVRVCDIQVIPVNGTVYKTLEDIQNSENDIDDYYHIGSNHDNGPSYCIKKELKVSVKPFEPSSYSYKYHTILQISVIALNHILSNTKWKSIVVNDVINSLHKYRIRFIHIDNPDLQYVEYPGNISLLFQHLKTNHTRTLDNIIIRI